MGHGGDVKPLEEPTQKPLEEPTQKALEEPTQKPLEPTQKPPEEPTHNWRIIHRLVLRGAALRGAAPPHMLACTYMHQCMYVHQRHRG